MSRTFPSIASPREFEEVRRDEGHLMPGARAVCERLGLEATVATRFPDGSLPVYAVGDSRVLKLYPPYDLVERDNETTVLGAIAGQLSIPTPQVQAVGELDGWGYLSMTRLHGEPLVAAWPRIPVEQRLRLGTDLGAALAVLHAVAGPALEPVRVDWPAFLARQRATAVERQAGHGLEQAWLAQIPEFLDGVALGSPKLDCLLHTEIMREHLLVENGPDGWRLSGLFDVEPAMVGAAEYEFASVGLFFSCGDSRLLRRVLLAYGYRERELGPGLGHRLMAYALLHRYSNLPWWLDRLPPHHGATTLQALAKLWWGT
jgi:hygromycin-B 7''-O-kinase